MTPGGFEAIEERAGVLRDRIAGCRRAVAASRAAGLAGAAVLALAFTAVAALRTPTVVLAAVAAVLGGTVWRGASTASLREAEEELAALDATREGMIDEVAARNGWRDMTPTVH